jgi:hypothetical protein
MILLDLLDASTLITANRDYYPIDQVPEFWSWLQHHGEAGRVKMPQEIMDEVKAGRKENDLLIDWITQPEVEAALLLQETVDIDLMQHVVSNGYAPDLNDVEVEAIGRDAFLIAYALAKPDERCVVTVEISKSSLKRQNRRIPDVCKDLGVQWCGPFALNKRLGFKTGWKA